MAVTPMNLAAQPGSNPGNDITAALDRLWKRFAPEIHERVALIESAAAACAAGRLSAERRKAANAAAHKLAGTLGTFNLARGTDLAREFEILTAEDCVPDADCSSRLVAIAAEIRSTVDSRR